MLKTAFLIDNQKWITVSTYLPEPLHDNMIGMIAPSIGSVALPIIDIDVTKATQ